MKAPVKNIVNLDEISRTEEANQIIADAQKQIDLLEDEKREIDKKAQWLENFISGEHYQEKK